MKRTVLYFGSFNPVHKGHIALAEWVVEHGWCDDLVMIVSPQSPFKTDDSLADGFARYEMASLAAASSRFPSRILVSVIELMMPTPSYTIDTLDALDSQFGKEVEFSILMGTDNIAGIRQWKDAERILGKYRILAYPRDGYGFTAPSDQTVLLESAPRFPFSSTDIRRRIAGNEDISEMVTDEVAAYIRNKSLWKCQDSK